MRFELRLLRHIIKRSRQTSSIPFQWENQAPCTSIRIRAIYPQSDTRSKRMQVFRVTPHPTSRRKKLNGALYLDSQAQNAQASRKDKSKKTTCGYARKTPKEDKTLDRKIGTKTGKNPNRVNRTSNGWNHSVGSSEERTVTQVWNQEDRSYRLPPHFLAKFSRENSRKMGLKRINGRMAQRK